MLGLSPVQLSGGVHAGDSDSSVPGARSVDLGLQVHSSTWQSHREEPAYAEGQLHMLFPLSFKDDFALPRAFCWLY